MNQAPRGTLYGIQYLRAFAALAVVLFHAAERTGHNFAIGAAGVDVFFVISGFIMWVVSERRPVSPARFVAERLRRIVPVYWLATAVMVAGGLAGAFPNLVLTAGHAAASFLFVPMRSPSSGEIWPVLVQGWTLNFEMFFYLVFAVSLWLPRGLRLRAVAALFVALVLLGQVYDGGSAAIEAFTRPIILEFVAGMILGQLWLKGRVATSVFAAAFVAAGLCGFAAIWWFGLPFDERVCGPLAVLLVAGTVSLEAQGAIRRLAFPAFLGDASYSIYIWHTFVISVVTKAGLILDLDARLVLVLAAVGGAAGGIAAYLLLERPLLRLGRSSLSPRNAPALRKA